PGAGVGRPLRREPRERAATAPHEAVVGCRGLGWQAAGEVTDHLPDGDGRPGDRVALRVENAALDGQVFDQPQVERGRVGELRPSQSESIRQRDDNGAGGIEIAFVQFGPGKSEVELAGRTGRTAAWGDGPGGG